MTVAWPWPGDSALTRARRIAMSYRTALRVNNRLLCDSIDETMSDFGESWVSQAEVTAEPDGLDTVTTAEAAELVHVRDNEIRRWATMEDPREPGRPLLPRFRRRGMDPLTLVVTALAAGATTGAGQTATAAVTAAYQALKQLVVRRFSGRPAAEVALAEHEADPEIWRAPLTKQLTETGTAADPGVIEVAQRLLTLLDADGARAGKYTVDASSAQGVQIGDHNTQTNRFGPG